MPSLPSAHTLRHGYDLPALQTEPSGGGSRLGTRSASPPPRCRTTLALTRDAAPQQGLTFCSTERRRVVGCSAEFYGDAGRNVEMSQRVKPHAASRRTSRSADPR